MRRSAFDVLILGGGTAGCVLASRLSEDPDRSVCLVEAGPDYGPFAMGEWPADMLDGRLPPDSHDWCDDHGRLPVARILGGCSAHNMCTLMHGAASDYDGWAQLTGDSGLGYEGFAPHLRRVEERMALRGEHELDPWYRGLAAAATELGLSVHDDANDPAEGLGRVPFNLRGTTRWNAAFGYLDPARERPNLTLASGAPVDRLTLDEHFDVPMRFAPSAAMMDEIARHREEADDATTQGVLKARTKACPEELWDLHLLVAVFPGDEGPVLAASAMLLQPNWAGRVRLRSTDPADLPIVAELDLEADDDLAAAFDGVDLARRLTATNALGNSVARELQPGAGATPEEIRARGRAGLTNYFHPVATCAMGATTDATGRVQGFENLHVVDASIIPRPLRFTESNGDGPGGANRGRDSGVTPEGILRPWAASPSCSR